MHAKAIYPAAARVYRGSLWAGEVSVGPSRARFAVPSRASHTAPPSIGFTAPSSGDHGTPSSICFTVPSRTAIIGVVRRVAGLLSLLLFLTGCAIAPHIDDDDRARIAGKTFVVTGASSGLGRGVALELAAQGANVVLAARRVEALDAVADEVRQRGGVPLVVSTDVGQPADIARLADAAVARFGRIDVWINNAGVVAVGRFEEIPVEDHARLIQTNIMGVIYGSHAAMRRFRAQGDGTLVNVASMESVVPLAYHASYSASKAAVFSLGSALYQEIRLSGQRDIHVASVLPWAVDTPIFRNAANYSGREARSVAPDDTATVVDAIVWISVHPQEALPVGWKARGIYVMHHLLPGTTESMAADIQHRTQFDDVPPAPATSGTLYR